MAAIDDYPWAAYHFYKIALQYYVVGRFAALTGIMPVGGNTLHHAVEMMLKGRLTHTLTLAQMAANPYRHCLPRIWEAFKALYPTEDLTRFDWFIAQLHDFDSIRYPDRVFQQGAMISVGLGSSIPPGGDLPERTRLPVYQLGIADLDALMNELFRLCSVNPQAYLHAFRDAVEVLRRHNFSCHTPPRK
jgi:hypothetical protein